MDFMSTVSLSQEKVIAESHAAAAVGHSFVGCEARVPWKAVVSISLKETITARRERGVAQLL
jgi:hypothetical protein